MEIIDLNCIGLNLKSKYTRLGNHIYYTFKEPDSTSPIVRIDQCADSITSNVFYTVTYAPAFDISMPPFSPVEFFVDIEDLTTINVISALSEAGFLNAIAYMRKRKIDNML